MRSFKRKSLEINRNVVDLFDARQRLAIGRKYVQAILENEMAYCGPYNWFREI